jgi:UPF0716 protein FxsA
MRRGLTLVPVALLLTALVEITVFVLLAQAIGFGWAFLLVLVTSTAGVLLLRREGMRAWRRFRDAANAGRPPGDQVTDGVVGLGAGLLLAIPGLVTSVIGLLLAVPPGRILARSAARRAAERRVPSGVAGDLFGPRRVRVRRGAPQPDPGPAGSSGTPADVVPGPVTAGPPIRGEIEGDVIEGEIVEGEIVVEPGRR